VELGYLQAGLIRGGEVVADLEHKRHPRAHRACGQPHPERPLRATERFTFSRWNTKNRTQSFIERPGYTHASVGHTLAGVRHARIRVRHCKANRALEGKPRSLPAPPGAFPARHGEIKSRGRSKRRDFRRFECTCLARMKSSSVFISVWSRGRCNRSVTRAPTAHAASLTRSVHCTGFLMREDAQQRALCSTAIRRTRGLHSSKCLSPSDAVQGRSHTLTPHAVLSLYPTHQTHTQECPWAKDAV
jgi:hypothetical protein